MLTLKGVDGLDKGSIKENSYPHGSWQSEEGKSIALEETWCRRCKHLTKTTEKQCARRQRPWKSMFEIIFDEPIVRQMIGGNTEYPVRKIRGVNETTSWWKTCNGCC